jgi:hypothetical protein
LAWVSWEVEGGRKKSGTTHAGASERARCRRRCLGCLQTNKLCLSGVRIRFQARRPAQSEAQSAFEWGADACVR